MEKIPKVTIPLRLSDFAVRLLIRIYNFPCKNICKIMLKDTLTAYPWFQVLGIRRPVVTPIFISFHRFWLGLSTHPIIKTSSYCWAKKINKICRNKHVIRSNRKYVCLVEHPIISLIQHRTAFWGRFLLLNLSQRPCCREKVQHSRKQGGGCKQQVHEDEGQC